MTTRLEHLEEMISGLKARMDVCDSDQNYAVMARVRREMLAELADLGGGEQPAPKETGLSDFEKRLREREAGSKTSGRASGQ